MTPDRLPTPGALRQALPLHEAARDRIAATRVEIAASLDDPAARLLVVVGPCSIHAVDAALEYAEWLSGVADRVAGRLLIVMRAYVEKPRTRLGWKGLVSDPGLDGSGRLADGLAAARELFTRVNGMGLPVGTEFVSSATPAYLADLVSWAAIGARTVESPSHREMASALPCPVGFKNATSGELGPAINAMAASRDAQTFLALGDDGRVAAVGSDGNRAGHLILRGGIRPNADAASIQEAAARLRADALPARVMVDCSHGNSGGDPARQLAVARDVARQIAGGSPAIMGVMLESFLRGGAQRLVPGRPLVHGQSITDACLDRDQTSEAIERLYDAVGAGRRRPPLVEVP